MKQRGWIAFSGFIWFFIGSFLLYKGLNFLSQAVVLPDSFCSRFEEPGHVATVLIAVGLIVGFLKGRFVLSKTVKRIVTRISALPLPIRFKDVYPKSYWILIGSMVALGMTLRFLPISIEVRGTIDVAIGSALVNGAMLYFRAILRAEEKLKL